MTLPQIDLIVENVIDAARRMSTLFGIEPDEVGERFAQLTVGGMIVMLSPDALVPMSAASGVILHVEIEPDVDPRHRAAEAGMTVLHGPVETDWGTSSTLVAGPHGVVVDLFRPLQKAASTGL